MTVLDRTRKKISDANILDRLLQHFAGTLEKPLNAGQIQIGLKLVNKIAPDLKQVEYRGELRIMVTKQDIDSRLIEFGIDADKVWKELPESIQ